MDLFRRSLGFCEGLVRLEIYVLIAVYLVVASILAWLVGISRRARERIYFALCTCSATFWAIADHFRGYCAARRAVYAGDFAEFRGCRRNFDFAVLLA